MNSECVGSGGWVFFVRSAVPGRQVARLFFGLCFFFPPRSTKKNTTKLSREITSAWQRSCQADVIHTHTHNYTFICIQFIYTWSLQAESPQIVVYPRDWFFGIVYNFFVYGDFLKRIPVLAEDKKRSSQNEFQTDKSTHCRLIDDRIFDKKSRYLPNGASYRFQTTCIGSANIENPKINNDFTGPNPLLVCLNSNLKIRKSVRSNPYSS